jgi:hypothetical protein
MSAEVQQWAIFLLGIACAGIGWFLHVMWVSIEQQRQEHYKLRDAVEQKFATVNDKFARRDDVRDMFTQVMERINSVFEEIKSVRDKLP